MNRFFATFSALALATALAAGCNKKEEAKPADSTGAAPSGAAGGEQPAAAAGAEQTATAAGEEKPAAGGATADLSIDEVCTKSVAMMEGMGAAVTANKGNCDGMGDALQKWADDNKDFIAWGKANEGDAAKKKDFEEKCGPKMAPVMQKLGTAMEGATACAENEKVKAAMAALE